MPGPSSKIQNKIMMSFMVVIVLFGGLFAHLFRDALFEILVTEGFPDDVIWLIIDRFTLYSSGLALLGIAVFVPLSLFFARAVTRPIKKLMQGVNTIAAGNFNTQVDLVSNDEFGQLADAVNRMAVDLRKFDEMKSEFVTTVSHELRTPLAVVFGYAELLRDQDFSAEQKRQFVEEIHSKAETLARMVDELLDVSRIEAGRGLELEKCCCDARELLGRSVETFRAASPRHQIELHLPAVVVSLNVDRVRMERVLDNLLSNAVKYSPGGGVIEVSLQQENEVWSRLTVRDQGIGMSREETGRIFEKFYRADTRDTAVPGFGLGMSIVRNIVEAHGGRIWVDSEVGLGTIVTLEIPNG